MRWWAIAMPFLAPCAAMAQAYASDRLTPAEWWAGIHRLREWVVMEGEPFPPAFDVRGPVGPGFPDVPRDHWAFGAVEKLQVAGIAVGYPNGTFSPPMSGPTEPAVALNADEVRKLLDVLAPRGPLGSFPDVRNDQWAQNAVQQLVDAGILIGYPSGGGQGPVAQDDPDVPVHVYPGRHPSVVAPFEW